MSNSLAYYLKYRPQTFDELIGQEAVKKILYSSFKNNKLSHAYLFVGPRGTGKTSTARILAKMVNCSVEQDPPCNKCFNCLSITDGSSLDLIEIDAASNRGIEDIRSLRDKIKLAPTAAKKKVYIIDEVHMLTPEAFNALLKTLEEPPTHALFILATTEGAKIPQTILSRTQKLDFYLASTKELLEALKMIAKKEKIDIEEEALMVLVNKADGSFRDGVKLLDQASSIGEKITAKMISDSFKSLQFENILELIQKLSKKDAAEALLSLNKHLERGADVKGLTLALMDTLRNLVLIKSGVGEQLVKANLTENKYQSLVEISKGFENQDLIKYLSILQKVLEQLKFATIISLPLELAFVEVCNSFKTNNLVILEDTPQITKNSEVEVRNDQKEALDEIPVETLDSPDILKLKEKWNFVLETIRPYNFSLEALLRSVNITKCTEDKIYMEVPYSFHQRILEAPKNRDLVEGVFSDILGRSIRIFTVLGSRPQRREDIANIEVAQDDEIIRAAAEIFNSDSIN